MSGRQGGLHWNLILGTLWKSVAEVLIWECRGPDLGNVEVLIWVMSDNSIEHFRRSYECDAFFWQRRGSHK